MAVGLFDVDDVESIIRKSTKGRGVIDLNDYDIPTYDIPENYTIKKCRFNPESYAKEIRSAIEPIVDLAESKGCAANLFTALYEGVLNAYQHGNKKDKDKEVTIAYSIKSSSAEVAIIDEGGVINSEFMPFVIRHREGKHKERFLDFYEFTGMEKPSTNNGTGTSFIHTYVDDVIYFKSDKGGLALHLAKKF